MADKGKGLYRLIALVFDSAESRKATKAMEDALTRAGEVGGKGFQKELRDAYNKTIAEARVKLAQGLIDKRQFQQAADEAARTFNSKLGGALQKLRAEGKLADAEFVSLSRSLKRVGDDGVQHVGRIHGAFTKLIGVAAGLFALNRIRLFGADSVREAADAERLWTQLGATLRNVGVDFDSVRGQLEAASVAFKQATRFDDEQFVMVLQTLVRGTGDFARSLQNVGLVADVAVGANLDLESAAKLVAKAMEGNTTALAKAGIIIPKTADAVEVLRERFHGLAEQDAKTLGGRLDQLNNAWRDFKEAIGTAATPALMRILPVLTSVVSALAGMTKWLEIVIAKAPLAAAKLELLALKAMPISYLPFGPAHRQKQDLEYQVGTLEILTENKIAEIEKRYNSLPPVLKLPAITPPPAGGGGATTPAKAKPEKTFSLDYDTRVKWQGETDNSTKYPKLPTFGATDIPGFGGGAGFTTELQRGAEAGIDAMRRMQTIGADVALHLETGFTNLGSVIIESFGKGAVSMKTFGAMAQAVGGEVVAGFAGGLAKLEEGKAAADFAEGIWPPNPAALLAAGEHLAAAGLFHALEAWGSSRSSAAASVGGGSAPYGATEVGGSAADRSQPRGPEINIYIDPLNPHDPAWQDNVGAAVQQAKERWGEDSTIHVYPRTGG